MQIKINVNQIKKDLLKQENYNKKDGSLVNNTVATLDIKMLKETKVVATSKDGNKELVKIGFVTYPSIKNQDGSYTNGDTIGDVQEWRSKNSDTVSTFGEDISSNIPF